MIESLSPAFRERATEYPCRPVISLGLAVARCFVAFICPVTLVLNSNRRKRHSPAISLSKDHPLATLGSIVRVHSRSFLYAFRVAVISGSVPQEVVVVSAVNIAYPEWQAPLYAVISPR